VSRGSGAGAAQTAGEAAGGFVAPDRPPVFACGAGRGPTAKALLARARAGQRQSGSGWPPGRKA